MLPVGLAFYSDDQLNPEWLVPNLLVDSILLLDILIIFRTIRISKKVRGKVSIKNQYILICLVVCVQDWQYVAIPFKTVSHVYIQTAVNFSALASCISQ